MSLDAEIKSGLRSLSEACLGTLDGTDPFLSAVSFLYEEDRTGGHFYLLLSALAQHTRNLKTNPAASLLIFFPAEGKSFYETPRLSVQGSVRMVTDESLIQDLRGRYPKHVPQAELFLTLADFCFYELVPQRYHWIGGFGKAQVMDA